MSPLVGYLLASGPALLLLVLVSVLSIRARRRRRRRRDALTRRPGPDTAAQAEPGLTDDAAPDPDEHPPDSE